MELFFLTSVVPYTAFFLSYITRNLRPILFSISQLMILHLCFRSSHSSLLSPLLRFAYLLAFLFLQLDRLYFFLAFAALLICFFSIPWFCSLWLSSPLVQTCYFLFSFIFLKPLSVHQLFVLSFVLPFCSPASLCSFTLVSPLFFSFLFFLFILTLWLSVLLSCLSLLLDFSCFLSSLGHSSSLWFSPLYSLWKITLPFSSWPAVFLSLS